MEQKEKALALDALNSAFFGTLVERENNIVLDDAGKPILDRKGEEQLVVRRPKHADNGWRNGHSHPVTFPVNAALKTRLATAGFVVSEEIPPALLSQLQAAGTPLIPVKSGNATFDRQPIRGMENMSLTLYNTLLAAIEAGEVA